MNNGYEQFIAHADAAVAAFPSLQKVMSEDRIILKGILQIIDADEQYWDEYEIEIHASDQYPARFPHLYETSGKIPRIADWHIYEDTGSCCTAIVPEEIIRCQKGITLTEYINEQVLPYLFNQTHRRVEGYYVSGEYAHGAQGLFQYYSEQLDTKHSIAATILLMRYISNLQEPPGRTSLCFCGSKRKYRHCHRSAYLALKALGRDVLQIHAASIEQRCR